MGGFDPALELDANSRPLNYGPADSEDLKMMIAFFAVFAWAGLITIGALASICSVLFVAGRRLRRVHTHTVTTRKEA